MSFKYPFIFILIIPIVFLLLYFHKKKLGSKNILYPFNNKGLQAITKKSYASRILSIFRVALFSLLLIALARPQTSSTQTKRHSEGIDIMIALDVSKSMLIEDHTDENRLKIAKRTVHEFVKGRSDDRIGFLMFSGESIALSPPTLDYEVLHSAISSANVNRLKDGTAIGDAIANAVNRLKNSKAKSKIIVLITDGDSNMGSIAPLTAGGLAKGYGIKVYSIAMGKEGTSKLPQTVTFAGVKQKRYYRVTSTINPELLQKISEETGGKFFRASQKGSLPKVFAQINKLERSKVETKARVRWSEHYQKYLFIALLLLLLEFMMARTRFRVLPN